ncbi:putative reverse transcriptase domain-containing protein [Tanacetum coccineum]
MCDHSYQMLNLASGRSGCVVAFSPQIREQRSRRVPLLCISSRVTRGLVVGLYKQAKEEMRGVLTLTWAAFKELLFLQFFPRAEQERLKMGRPFHRQRASENKEAGKELSVPQRSDRGIRWRTISVGHSAGLFIGVTIRTMSSGFDGQGRWLVTTVTHNNQQKTYSRDNNRNSGADATKRNRGSQKSRVPSKGYTTLLVIFSGLQEEHGASSSGHADMKQTHQACFALLKDQAQYFFFIKFDDKIRSVNALPLDMCEFDIILGIDWLAAHRAMIDCHSRRVIFGDIHAPEFIYHGSLPGKSRKIISALISCTLIVSDFRTYFRKELPEYLLFADVGINIELIPELSQISKLLSHGTRLKLKELKDLLQELLGARFYSPSVSHGCTGYDCQEEGRLIFESGYHQLRVKSKDISNDAIRTRYGLYEYLVYAFWSSRECSSVLWTGCAKFWLSKVGISRAHRFSRWNYLDRRKVVRLNTPNARPTSVTEVRSFLDSRLLPQIRRGFLMISLTLNQASRKGEKFVWNEEREKSFEELKQTFVPRTILTQQSGTGGFQIYSDASKKIKAAQKDDGEIWAIIQNIDQQTEFRVDDDGILWQGTKLCVPEVLHLGSLDDWRLISSSIFRFIRVDEMYTIFKQPFVEWKCRAPICWDQVGERILEGPEMIEVTNEKVAVAREKLKEAQTRQKSYADRHRRALEFQPGQSHEEQDKPLLSNSYGGIIPERKPLGRRGVLYGLLILFSSIVLCMFFQ